MKTSIQLVLELESKYKINFEFQDKLCDRNYSSLVFDSVVAIERGSEVRFWLFYGDVFYESNPMEIGSDERPTFQVKRNVTEIHPNISAPIDLSYYRNYTIGLVNVSPITITIEISVSFTVVSVQCLNEMVSRCHT